MHSLPQANITNPAVQIECPIFIGIPALSSIHAGYSNSYCSYNNVIIKNNDTIIPNISYAFKYPNSRQYINSELHLSILNFGFKNKRKYYFNFNIQDKIEAGIIFPTNLIRFPFEGNTAHVGENYNLSGLRIFGIYYREWALSISKVINNKLTAGIRGKILFGKANIHTFKNNIFLYTSSDIYQLNASSDITIKTSPIDVNINNSHELPEVNFPENISVKNFLLNGKNKGIALDIGVLYNYNENITFSASILDIGCIYWKFNPSMINEKSTFEFNGFYYNPNTNEFEGIDNLIDSFQYSYSFSTNTLAYFTLMSPKFYFGGIYYLNDYLNSGLLLRNELYHKRRITSITSSLNGRYKKICGSISWTVINKSLLNFGCGIGLNITGFGFYALSDNLIAAFKYKSVRYTNIRFGFNLLLGCKKAALLKKSTPTCAAYRDVDEKKIRFQNWLSKMKKNK